MTKPSGYKMIRVRRDRHAWPAGYFDDLVSTRIPFPDDATGDSLEGVLMQVTETERWISLIFHGVAREAADAVE